MSKRSRGDDADEGVVSTETKRRVLSTRIVDTAPLLFCHLIVNDLTTDFHNEGDPLGHDNRLAGHIFASIDELTFHPTSNTFTFDKLPWSSATHFLDPSHIASRGYHIFPYEGWKDGCEMYKTVFSCEVPYTKTKKISTVEYEPICRAVYQLTITKDLGFSDSKQHVISGNVMIDLRMMLGDIAFILAPSLSMDTIEIVLWYVVPYIAYSSHAPTKDTHSAYLPWFATVPRGIKHMEFMVQEPQQLRDFLSEAGAVVYGGGIDMCSSYKKLFELLVKSIYYQETYHTWEPNPRRLIHTVTKADKWKEYVYIRQREW